MLKIESPVVGCDVWTQQKHMRYICSKVFSLTTHIKVTLVHIV